MSSALRFQGSQETLRTPSQRSRPRAACPGQGLPVPAHVLAPALSVLCVAVCSLFVGWLRG